MSYIRPEIARMRGYVPGEQPQAGKFIKLNTNENPYPPSPAVKQAISTVLEHGLSRYPDPLGTAFRRRAGEVLKVDPDWILCGNGSDDILTIVTRALVGERQWLRLPYPSYILYKSLAELQGAGAEEVLFEPDWSLSDKFSEPLENIKLAFLPNPNSPSGTVLSPERILQLAERLPCPLLVDEAYADFAERNCLSLVAQNEKIMVSRSLSKSYALAGLRFGYLVAQPHMIREFVKVKDSYNVDALSLAGACAAIDDQAWLADNRAKIIDVREKLSVGMRALGFATVESQANFVWNPHPQIPLRPIFERLKAERILVRYMDYEGWGDGLRVSVGTAGQIDACLALLRTMI
jgi:histidinol-phosphate aminotransferase